MKLCVCEINKFRCVCTDECVRVCDTVASPCPFRMRPLKNRNKFVCDVRIKRKVAVFGIDRCHVENNSEPLRYGKHYFKKSFERGISFWRRGFFLCSGFLATLTAPIETSAVFRHSDENGFVIAVVWFWFWFHVSLHVHLEKPPS